MSSKQIIAIEQNLRSTGRFEQIEFTIAELEDLAKLIQADVIDIMFYLRYER